MDKITKPNDILVATLKAPESTTLDLLKNNINANNTSFLTPEEYKQTPLVLKTFTNDKGVFDEEMFNKAYLLAYNKYLELVDKDLEKNLEKQLEYNENSRYKPLDAKTYDKGYSLKTLKNPLQKSYSLSGINEISEPKLTEEEAAQSNFIFDPKSNKFLTETPESLSFLNRIFGKTLVYAKYEESGLYTNPETGEKEWHEKGEWKTDKNGNYYTEILGNRELLDKQVVSSYDILTKEDSWLNKVDFFDSDGYDKSAWGIAFKTALSIVPYLIPAISPYYTALTTTVGLSSVLPTVYKTLESLVTGDNSSNLYRSATLAENWFRKWDKSTSRKGKESFWTLEQLALLTGDVFSLLYQQKAVASLSKYFKTEPKEFANVGERLKFYKDRNELATRLSLGYMALTSAADVYNEALLSGYNNRTAGMTSLLSMVGLYGVMKYNSTKNGLGTWFLDKTTGYDAEVARGPITKIAKSLYKEFDEGFKKMDLTGDKSSLKNTILKFKTQIKDKAQDIFVIGGEDIWKNSLTEGVEEVTEEIIQDTVKGIIDISSYLGIPDKQGSFGGWENVFSKEGLSRYLSTFVGGAIGGALFETNRKYIEPFINGEPILRKVDYDLIEALTSGRYNEIMTELDKMKGIFNNKLSPLPTDIDGKSIYKQAKDGETLSDIIIQQAKNKVNAIKFLIMLELDGKELDVDFKKNIKVYHFANLFKNSGFDENYLKKQWTNAVSNYVEAKQQYESIKSQENSNKDTIKVYENKLKEASEILEGFYSGENYTNYVMDGNILFNKQLRKGLLNLDIETYTQNLYKVDYHSLKIDSENPNELTKNKIDQEYQYYIKETLQDDDLIISLPIARKILLNLLESSSDSIDKFININKKSELLSHLDTFDEIPEITEKKLELKKLKDELNDILLEENSDIILEKINKLESDIIEITEQQYTKKLIDLIKTNPKALSISDTVGFDLAQILIDKGFINLDNFKIKTEEGESDEIINTIKNLINIQANLSKINYWDKKSIITLLKNINLHVLSNLDNIFVKKILESFKKIKSSNNLLDINSLIIKYDENKELDEDITNIKLKNVLDLINKQEIISEDLFDIVGNIYYQMNKDFIDIVINNTRDSLDDEDMHYISDLSLKKIIDLYAMPFNSKENSEYNYVEKYNVTDNLELNALSLLKDNLKSLKTFNEDLINLYKKIKENPLKGIFKNIYFLINGSSLGEDIFDFLDKTEFTFQDKIKLEGFNLDSKKNNILESTIKTIDTIKTIVEAMVHSDTASISYNGISYLMNTYITLYQNNSKLKDVFKIIKPEDAEYIYKYLDSIKEKLDFIRQVSKEATFNKTKKYEELRANFNSNMSKFYRQGVSIDVNGEKIELLKPNLEEPKESNEDFIFKSELTIFENLLKFKETHSKKDLNSLIDAIIDKFKENILDSDLNIEELIEFESGKITNQNNHFIAKRILSLLEYSPKEWISDFKKILEDNPDIYAKIDQELVLRDFFSYLKNKEAYDLFLGKIINATSGESKIIELKDKIYKTLFNNTVTILGSAGSGKTLCGLFILEKLKLNGNNIILTALSQRKVDDLKKSITLDENDKSDTFFNLFKSLESLNGTLSEKLDEIITEGKKILKDSNLSKAGITIKKLGVKSKIIINLDEYLGITDQTGIIFSIIMNDDSSIGGIELESYNSNYNTLIPKNSAVLIDEITLINPLLVLLLSKIANENNSFILLLGDNYQPGYKIKHNGSDHYLGIKNILGLNTINLYGSFRANNNAKESNNSLFRSVFLTNKEIFSSNNDTTFNESENKKLENDISRITLTSHTSKYLGDGFVDKSISISKIIDLVKSAYSLKKTIAIISDDSLDKIKQELENKVNSGNLSKEEFDLIDFKNSESVLGAEYNYTVIYDYKKNNSIVNNADNDLRLMYGLITRSKDYSLVVEDDKGLFKSYNILFKKDPDILEVDSNISYNELNKKYRDYLEYIDSLLDDVPLIKFKDDVNDDNGNNDNKDKDKDTKKDLKNNLKDNENAEDDFKDSENEIRNNFNSVFDTSTILESYYIRLGIPKNKVNVKTGTHNVSDFSEYDINFDYPFYASASEGGSILSFIQFKNQLLSQLHNSKNLEDYFIGVKKFDADIDYCYKKPNDAADYENLNIEGNVKPNHVFVLMKKVEINGKIGYITLGLISKNVYTKGENEPDFTYFNEYLNLAGDNFILFSLSDTNKDNSSNVRIYLENKNTYSENDKTGSKFFIRYTNLRDFSLTKEPSELYDGKTYDKLAVLLKNNKNNFSFNNGFIKYSDLHLLGFTIKPEIITFKNEKDLINAYNSYRSEPLNKDLEKKIAKLYKKKWVILTVTDSNGNQIPGFSSLVLINKIIHPNKLLNNYNTETNSNNKEYLRKQIYYNLYRTLYKNENITFEDSNKYLELSKKGYSESEAVKKLSEENVIIFDNINTKSLTAEDFDDIYIHRVYETPNFIIDLSKIKINNPLTVKEVKIEPFKPHIETIVPEINVSDLFSDIEIWGRLTNNNIDEIINKILDKYNNYLKDIGQLITLISLNNIPTKVNNINIDLSYNKLLNLSMNSGGFGMQLYNQIINKLNSNNFNNSNDINNDGCEPGI